MWFSDYMLQPMLNPRLLIENKIDMDPTLIELLVQKKCILDCNYRQ